MQIIVSELAVADIREGYAFYARQDIRVAERFMETVTGKLRLLESIGGVHARVHRCFRMLAFPFPFAIYYTLRSDTVVVRAVLDCRREPKRHRDWTR